MYQVFLGLHIVGVVSWFAGLFYLVRLLVNQSEVVANDQEGKEYIIPQLSIMTDRLYRIITLPAAIFTLVTGVVLMELTSAYYFPWFHLKVVLVIVLFVYHFYTYRLIRRFKNQFINVTNKVNFNKFTFPVPPASGKFLRYYNEGATLLLVAIVFLVVMKDIKFAFLVWLGFVLFLLGFMLIFQLRKKLQTTDEI